MRPRIDGPSSRSVHAHENEPRHAMSGVQPAGVAIRRFSCLATTSAHTQSRDTSHSAMASTSRRARSPAPPAATALAIVTERPREQPRSAPPWLRLPAELVLLALSQLHDDDRASTADARCAQARDYVDDLLECSVVCRRWREPAQHLLARLLVLGKPEPFARGNGWSASLEDRFMMPDGIHCRSETVGQLKAIFTHTNLSPFEATLLDNLGVFLRIEEVVGWGPGTADSRGIEHAHLRDADVTSLELPVLRSWRTDAWDQPPDDTPPLMVPRALESISSFRVDLSSLVPAPDHAMSLVGRLCAMSSTLRRLRIDHCTLPAVDTLLSTEGVSTGGIEILELSVCRASSSSCAHHAGLRAQLVHGPDGGGERALAQDGGGDANPAAQAALRRRAASQRVAKAPRSRRHVPRAARRRAGAGPFDALGAAGDRGLRRSGAAVCRSGGRAQDTRGGLRQARNRLLDVDREECV